MKIFLKKLLFGRLNFLFKALVSVFAVFEFALLNLIWKIRGGKKPTLSEQREIAQKVTFIYKSFERQKMAKRLHKNIRKYYPNVRIIIADDSKVPLEISDDNVEIIRLPFNSGLSVGLNKMIQRVHTPYVIRLDDDMLLTPFSNFHKHLNFLESESRVDLVAISYINSLRRKKLSMVARKVFGMDMKKAFKSLLIPHLTKISGNYIVVGKPPNIFIVRTEAIRKVGYDDNIRMIDHHEFFMRAAGEIVSVFDSESFVYHYNNRLDKNYRKYRTDYLGDKKYIYKKTLATLSGESQK